MAKKRKQQLPEDSTGPAAAADQQPNTADDPGRVTITLQGKRVTITPKKHDADPEEEAAAEKKIQEAQKRLADAFNNSPAAKIAEHQRRINEMLQNPAIESVMQQQALIDRLTAGTRQVTEINQTIADAMRSPAIEAVQYMVNTMQDVLETVSGTFLTMQKFFNSESWANARQTLEQIAAAAPALLELAREVEELTPYLEAELKKPEYQGKTLDDLAEEAETDSDGIPTAESMLMRAITAARAARDAAAAKDETPRATVTRAQTVEYPLDKPNQIIWNLLEKDTAGQVTFNMAKQGRRQQVLTYYSINFDDLPDVRITKRLLPFDKRVYIAVSALFNAGNTVITLSQIYYAMGYKQRPCAADLEKINSSITKMTTAHIYLDNKQEADKYKYPHFKYDASLLPLERGTVIVNGRLADAAIKIFREPPLITFAKQRQQITTVSVELLQGPLSKTNANLQIEDYLIERISRERNKRNNYSCRILFKTLYAHAGIPDRPTTNAEKQQKKRAPEKIRKCLTHYQAKGFIDHFKLEQDGVTVYW